MTSLDDLQRYASHLSGDDHRRLSTLTTMAEHKGACESLLAAMTLLRRLGHGDAADVLLEHVAALVPEVKPIEEVTP